MKPQAALSIDRKLRAEGAMGIGLAVAAAGFLGAAARYGLGMWLPDGGGGGTGMPWATLLVNLGGSLLLGLLLGVSFRRPVPLWLKEAAGTGFLGAFTTFSAFNGQLFEMVRNEHYGLAAAYIALSAGAGWLLAAGGLSWGRGRRA